MFAWALNHEFGLGSLCRPLRKRPSAAEPAPEGGGGAGTACLMLGRPLHLSFILTCVHRLHKASHFKCALSGPSVGFTLLAQDLRCFGFESAHPVVRKLGIRFSGHQGAIDREKAALGPQRRGQAPEGSKSLAMPLAALTWFASLDIEQFVCAGNL